MVKDYMESTLSALGACQGCLDGLNAIASECLSAVTVLSLNSTDSMEWKLIQMKRSNNNDGGKKR